jgi:hypothetical protein
MKKTMIELLTFKQDTKPWTDFCSVSQFNIPLTPQDAHMRATANALAYRNNYITMCTVGAMLLLCTSPKAVACICILGGCIYCYFKNPRGIATHVTSRHFVAFVCIYAALVFVFTDTLRLASAGGALAGLFSAAHAVFFEKAVDFV